MQASFAGEAMPPPPEELARTTRATGPGRVAAPHPADPARFARAAQLAQARFKNQAIGAPRPVVPTAVPRPRQVPVGHGIHAIAVPSLQARLAATSAGGRSGAVLLPTASPATSPPGRGMPLPPILQRKMETLFGADFSTVRVHVGPQPGAIGALAFTMGSDLYFAPGQFQPTTRAGEHLLARQLSRVVQQRTGQVVNPFGRGIALVPDPAPLTPVDRTAGRPGRGGVGLEVRRLATAAQRRVAPLGPRSLQATQRARAADPFGSKRAAVTPGAGLVAQRMKRSLSSEGLESTKKLKKDTEEIEKTDEIIKTSTDRKNLENENFERLSKIPLTLEKFGGPQVGYVVNGTKQNAPRSQARSYQGNRHIQVLRHIGIAVYVLARLRSNKKTDQIIEVQSMYAYGNLYIATNNKAAAEYLEAVLKSDWAQTYAELDTGTLKQTWNGMTENVTKRVIKRIKKRIELYHQDKFTFATFDEGKNNETGSLAIAKEIWKVATAKSCTKITTQEQFRNSLEKQKQIYVVMADGKLHAEMNFLPIIDMMKPEELKLIAGKKRQCFTCFVRLAMRQNSSTLSTLITQTTRPGNLWRNQLGFIEGKEAESFMTWCYKNKTIQSVVTTLKYEPDKIYINYGSGSESEEDDSPEDLLKDIGLGNEDD